MRRLAVPSPLVLLLAGCTAAGGGADPGPDGGGPGGADAGWVDPGGPPGEVLWHHHYSLQVVFAPAVAPDGTVVVQGDETLETPEGGPTVLAIAPGGEVRWSAVTSPGAVPAPPATIHGGEVLVPAALTGAKAGRLYRYELESGSALPAIDLTGPITDGLAVGPDGTIYAPATPLQAIRDGQVAWSYAMVDGGKTGSNAAVGPSGTIYVGGRGVVDHNLHAVNPDGSERWKRDVGASIIDPIAIDAEERVYAVNGDGVLVAHDADGTLAWSVQLDSYNSGGGIVIGPDRTVYVGTIGTEPGVYIGEYLYAVREGAGGQGEIVWQARVGLSWIGTTPALSAGGTLYVSDFCRDLIAVRASDGQELWRFRIDGLAEDRCAGFSAPALGPDGTVYVWNEGIAGSGAGGGLYALRGDGTGPAPSAWAQEGRDPGHSSRVDGPTE